MTKNHAYRVLGLEAGASMEQVEEAFADLQAVWDPARFEDNAELRGKAERKRAQIASAADLLRRAAAGTPQESRQDLYKAIYSGSPRRRDEPQKPRRDEGGKPSLLSDTFSSERHQSQFPVPLWAIGAGLFALVIVIIFLMAPGEPAANPVVTAPPQMPEMTEPITSATPIGRPPEPTADAEPEPITPPPPQPQARRTPSSPPPETTPPPTRSAPPPPDPTPARSGPRPRLLRNPAGTPAVPPGSTARETSAGEGEQATEIEESASEEAAVEPTVDPGAEQAFELLQAQSDPALQLSGGLVEGLAFVEWRLAGKRNDEYLIDLVATTADGREHHHVWSVDPAAETVRALSQAARDLERRLGP